MKCATALVILAVGVLGAALAGPAFASRQQAPLLRATPHVRFESQAGIALGITSLTASGGAGAVNGRVYAFDGSPIEAAQVYVGWREGASSTFLDPVSTDPTGSYSASGVPVTNMGVVQAALSSHDYLLRKGLTFADPGPSTFDLRPGTIGFATTRVTSGWGDWTSLAIYTMGSAGEARTISTSGMSGSAWAMGPDVSRAVAYYWSNEAAEYRFASAAAVSPGTDAGVAASFKEGAAFRMWIAKPYWWSGKPGSSLELHYSAWPAGTPARFLGAPGYPEGAPAIDFGGKHLVSAGTKEAVTKVTVPSSVKPGYAYTVEMYRPENPVWIDLSVRFQVCTLNASRTSMRSGGAVKLSGVVPVSGHVGAQPGAPVTVTVYRRTTSASQPTAWDATTRGWAKVGSYATTGLGAFHTRYLHPTHSTWYVARYSGSYVTGGQNYLRAYTSVRKVRVY
jgi:hypothetical protein